MATIDLLADAALAAGQALLGFYGQRLEIAEKADRSPVTEADRASEALILQTLRRTLPDLPVIAEEGVDAGALPPPGQRYLLVDPLDGTGVFIRGGKDFTVNIALIENASPQLGVVYAPAHGWLYAGDITTARAWRREAHGAQRTSEPPSLISARRPPAEGLTVLISSLYHSGETEAWLQTFAKRERIASIRPVGSALKFCLLACGEADLYPRMSPTMEWDTAAGHAILLAAGGSVTTPSGTPLLYGKPHWRNGPFIARGK